MGRLNLGLKLSLLTTSAALLSACGAGFEPPKVVESKTFTTMNSGQKTQYQVDLERPDFSNTPQQTSADQVQVSDPELAARVQHVRLDIAGDELDEVHLSVKIIGAGNRRSQYAQFALRAEPSQGSQITFKGRSQDGQFEASGICAGPTCDESSITFTENTTKKIVQIQYVRRNEFLKEEDLLKFQVSAKDLALLKDAAEYHFPIVRHAAKISGRAQGQDVVDLLIIERPPVDEVAEDFNVEGEAEPEVVFDNPIPDAGNENHVIELESNGKGTVVRALTPAFKPAPTSTPAAPAAPAPQPPPLPTTPKQKTPEAATPAPAPKKETPSSPAASPAPEKPAAAAREELQAQQPTTASDAPATSRLALTPNPYDVYKIEIPTSRLRGTLIKDPVKLINFAGVVPAEQQTVFEPAFRISVLAEAFITQNIKVYRNACNIFVRSVMTLAGYTRGGLYNANGFGTLFQTKSQGLDKWEKLPYVYRGAGADFTSKVSTIQRTLDNLPEAYGTVYQIIRQGRHGHVGIITRLDGVTYMIDSSIDQYGPRKQQINARQLFNSGSRRVINMYGIKGIMQTGIQSI